MLPCIMEDPSDVHPHDEASLVNDLDEGVWIRFRASASATAPSCWGFKWTGPYDDEILRPGLCLSEKRLLL